MKAVENSVRIGCVCFDWGGVILRICRSMEEGARRAGLEWRPECQTPERKARRRQLSLLSQTGRLAPQDLAPRMSDAMDGIYSAEEFQRLHDAWLIEEYAGAGALLSALTAREDVTTAMLSNTDAWHWARRSESSSRGLAHFPSAAMVRHAHASHLLGLMKPDAGIYDAFCRVTAIVPTSILFFDDLEENVQAARSRGWHAERIDPDRETAPQITQHLERYGVTVPARAAG